MNGFNPQNNFHLSLAINYPNASDRILGVRGRLGGNICIHGNCVTIGCVPITDEMIKELYLIAVEARTSGQSQTPVHIFPRRMDDDGMKVLSELSTQDSSLAGFWKNLKAGHDFFEKGHRLPRVTVDKSGTYLFAK